MFTKFLPPRPHRVETEISRSQTARCLFRVASYRGLVVSLVIQDLKHSVHDNPALRVSWKERRHRGCELYECKSK